ncbi:MAG TPA: TadE/TadG family type IV pilus assembly protein [Caulobacteraceae bacterium]|nr:TadE/TadG family type IV pilus assembly protein [Caulobacteraceae bacterium]
MRPGKPRRLFHDARGVAAVEFALIAPLLLLLYFGVVELTQGAMTEQRAAHTASTIADLVAQDQTITAAQVSDIFSVGGTLMYPYPTTTLKMRVSSLTADAHDNVTVAWSQASGMTALTKGASVTVPANVISAGGSAIMGETQYTYTSVFGRILPQPVVFNEVYYLQPRLSPTVTCSDC